MLNILIKLLLNHYRFIILLLLLTRRRVCYRHWFYIFANVVETREGTTKGANCYRRSVATSALRLLSFAGEKHVALLFLSSSLSLTPASVLEPSTAELLTGRVHCVTKQCGRPHNSEHARYQSIAGNNILISMNTEMGYNFFIILYLMGILVKHKITKNYT